MRVVTLLILFVIGLGIGTVPVPASAEPCLSHADHTAATGHESHGSSASPGEPVVLAALDHSGANVTHPVSDHAVPDGHFCCHIPSVTPTVGLMVEPYRHTARSSYVRSGLPPWAAPATGIYRPPAYA